MSIHDFIALMIALVWPVTILILVLWFREGIKNLIASVVEAKIGNSLFVKFGQSPSDATASKLLPPSVAERIIAPLGIRWERSANLFWLGSDLEWTAQTILRGAPRERVIHGLTKCNDHTSELGLADSVPGKQLSALKAQVESLSEEALTRQWRNDFAEKIRLVIQEFSILAKQHQPGFKPDP